MRNYGNNSYSKTVPKRKLINMVTMKKFLENPKKSIYLLNLIKIIIRLIATKCITG